MEPKYELQDIDCFLHRIALGGRPAGCFPAVSRVRASRSDVRSPVLLAPLRDGLAERGWIEGRNVAFEPRFHEGKPERFAEFAMELARLPLDVIVTGAVPPTRAVKQATQTIPIVVAAATDPAGTGLVTPGGNVAAFDVLPPDAAAQQLALLREVVPALRRVVLVWSGSNPASQLNARRVQEAAQVLALEVRRTHSGRGLEGPFSNRSAGGPVECLSVSSARAG
jgi:ABC-type uncharacterized transport system substrate-binding protein